MELKSVMEEIGGFRFMLDNLKIQSPLARRSLGSLQYLHSAEEIEAELERVERLRFILCDGSRADTVARLDLQLMQVRDIRGTAVRVTEGQRLDDIELFEVKAFALLACEIRELVREAGIDVVEVADLEEIVTILDPERMRVPHFYVYDAYSEELAALRGEMKRLKSGAQTEESAGRMEELMFAHSACEDEIRAKLSADIHIYNRALRETLDAVAKLDILMAKARQAVELGLCRPSTATTVTRYKAIFHPQVREIFTSEGKRYQAIDIDMMAAPALVTGANMAGKSLMMKTVALAQALFQFGFYVPAEEAAIVPVDEILICMGDEQSELSGLSSFASEMLRIDAIVRKVKAGVKALVLIDEPARTTNPTEGKAIVSAMLTLLAGCHARALVTTHYSGITAGCRKLRVKGFMEEQVRGNLTVHNIGEYIDYSIVEAESDAVPEEALRIARILGVDDELLRGAAGFLKQNK